jgi:Ran GTPase-activating protein (RanGAP) involved in mRNA processing and transport
LTVLTLTLNHCGSEGAQHLARFLCSNTTLNTLRLGANIISDTGVRALADVLNHKTGLTHLDIRASDARNIKEFCEALARNTTLKVLDLSWNQLSSESLSALCAALKVHRSLHTLFLSSCHVGDKGAELFGKILTKTQSLKVLNLSHNQIGPKGGKALSVGLTKNHILTHLSLRGNQLQQAGAGYLARMIEVNTSLQLLDITSNAIDSIGEELLSAALAKNRYLTSLGRSYQAANTMAGHFQHNKELARRRQQIAMLSGLHPKLGKDSAIRKVFYGSAAAIGDVSVFKLIWELGCDLAAPPPL